MDIAKCPSCSLTIKVIFDEVKNEFLKVCKYIQRTLIMNMRKNLVRN